MSWNKAIIIGGVLGIGMVGAPAYAAVQISEIAWMGTSISANDEWIELHNTGTSAVDLTGWKITASDGAPDIELEGSISAGGWYLLERTDDETVPTVKADHIYSGALGNTGEDLRLMDANENEADRVNATGGWPAGDSVSRDTMQRASGSSWITAPGTPRAQNATTGSLPDDEESENENPTTTAAQPASPATPAVPISWKAEFSIPSSAVAQIPVSFHVSKLEHTTNIIHLGAYHWNMGDGTVYEFTNRDAFNHTYEVPGTYFGTVTFAPYPGAQPVILHPFKITVAKMALVMHVDTTTGSVTIENTGSKEISLDEWSLWARDGTSFRFPKRTRIPPRETLVLHSKVVQLDTSATYALLLMPDGSPAASWKRTPLDTSDALKHESGIAHKANGGLSAWSPTINLRGMAFLSAVNIPEDTVNDRKSSTRGNGWLWALLAGAIAIVAGLAVFMMDTKEPLESGSEDDIQLVD